VAGRQKEDDWLEMLRRLKDGWYDKDAPSVFGPHPYWRFDADDPRTFIDNPNTNTLGKAASEDTQASFARQRALQAQLFKEEQERINNDFINREKAYEDTPKGSMTYGTKYSGNLYGQDPMKLPPFHNPYLNTLGNAAKMERLQAEKSQMDEMYQNQFDSNRYGPVRHGSSMTFGDARGDVYGQDPMKLPTGLIGTKYSGGPLQSNLAKLQQDPSYTIPVSPAQSQAYTPEDLKKLMGNVPNAGNVPNSGPTDDFGNPLATDDFGNYHFETLRDREIARLNDLQFSSGGNVISEDAKLKDAEMDKILNNSDEFKNYSGIELVHHLNEAVKDIPFAGDVWNIINPISDIKGFYDTVTDPELRGAIIDYAMEHPAQATIGGLSLYIASKGGTTKKLWDKTLGRIYNKKKSVLKRDAKTGRMLPAETGFNVKKLLEHLTGGYVATKLGLAAIDEAGFNVDIDSLNHLSSSSSDDQESGQVLAKPGSINPHNTEALEKLMGQAGATNTNNTTPSWVAKAVNAKSPQKGGGMLGAIPGGSGGWDNPLFRIGELMREMDAPGSWGLDGKAASRWSKSAEAHAAAQAVAGKSSMAAKNAKWKAQRSIFTDMIKAQAGNLHKKYLYDQDFLDRINPLALGKKGIEAAAHKAAQDEQLIKYEMIQREPPIEPTAENYRIYLEFKASGQLK